MAAQFIAAALRHGAVACRGVEIERGTFFFVVGLAALEHRERDGPLLAHIIRDQVARPADCLLYPSGAYAERYSVKLGSNPNI